MSDELDLMSEAEAVELIAGAGQLVNVTHGFDMSRLPELVRAIQVAIPGLQLNKAAIAKGGKRKDGGKVVPFSAKRRSPTPVSITVYATTGTITWAGCDAIKLPPKVA